MQYLSWNEKQGRLSVGVNVYVGETETYECVLTVAGLYVRVTCQITLNIPLKHTLSNQGDCQRNPKPLRYDLIRMIVDDKQAHTHTRTHKVIASAEKQSLLIAEPLCAWWKNKGKLPVKEGSPQSCSTQKGFRSNLK